MADKIRADWAKLTPKQRASIARFIKHGNKLRAYRETYNCENMSQKTLRRNCYAHFSLPHIKAVIDQIQAEAVRRAQIQLDEIIDGNVDDVIEEERQYAGIAVDADWVLRRAALLADFNINKFIKTDEDGNAIYDFSTASDDDWYCIQEYSADEIVRGQGDNKYRVDKLKLKSYDKLRALEIVGKHIDVQAFKEQSDLHIQGGLTHSHKSLDDFYKDIEAGEDED